MSAEKQASEEGVNDVNAREFAGTLRATCRYRVQDPGVRILTWRPLWQPNLCGAD
jgi:hypothetical protein